VGSRDKSRDRETCHGPDAGHECLVSSEHVVVLAVVKTRARAREGVEMAPCQVAGGQVSPIAVAYSLVKEALRV
jgi:hypothetical protein